MEDDYPNRYLFTVRQQFGEEPNVDTFYKVKIPPGLSGSEADMLQTLKPGWYEKEINEDSRTIQGMELRLRYNSDMYQRVCMVTCEAEIDADMLDTIIKQKHRDGILKEFLDKSAIK